MKFEISVFPNTGCRIIFIPLAFCDQSFNTVLADVIPDDLKGEIADNTKDIIQDDLSAIVDYVKKGNCDWKSIPNKAWLRWRIGPKFYSTAYQGIIQGYQAEVAGLWFAIETNLGTHQRGLIAGELPPSPYDLVKYPSPENKIESPYRFENYSQIEDHPDLHSFRLDTTGFDISSTKRLGGPPALPGSTKRQGGPPAFDWRPSSPAPGQSGSTTAGENINSVTGFTIELIIHWKKPNVVQPIDVDLIVDLGNTRTAAVLLERQHAKGGKKPEMFPTYCRSVNLKNNEAPLAAQQSCNSSITPSWILLKEPTFSIFPDEITEPVFAETTTRLLFLKKKTTKCTKLINRIPHLFTNVSPAVWGHEAEKALHRPYTRDLLNAGANIIQSSPKRYYWDSRPRTPVWNMLVNDVNANITNVIPQLKATILRLMLPDAGSWTIQSPPTALEPSKRPKSPRKVDPAGSASDKQDPRSATIVWMLTGILEEAWRQMNNRNAKVFIPYVFKSVVATYPSGWSLGEIECYKERWQQAINIFHLTNNDVKTPCPELSLSLDEAVASQLPVIFSSVTHMGSVGENFFRLMGHDPDSPSMRAMNIDIGGGTTDVSIIYYKDTQPGMGVNLETTLLFKHSFSIAGDELVKNIIGRMILPQMCDDLDAAQKAKNLDVVRRELSQHMDAGKEAIRSSYVRRVLIPWATHILQNLSEGGDISLSAKDVGIDPACWTDFCKWLELGAGHSSVLPLPLGKIDSMIEEIFGEMLDNLSAFVAAFDVDMVILSGKPTEIPTLREMIYERMPIPRNRIVSSKNFYSGSWYPFKSDDFIADAKSVTVTGAALERAMRCNLIEGWKINTTKNLVDKESTIWSSLNVNSKKMEIALLKIGETQSDPNYTIAIGTKIGKVCAELSDFPEPVYTLQWSSGEANNVEFIRGIVFERLTSDLGESVVISRDCSPMTSNDESIPVESLKLVLQPTWSDGDFWMDTGKIDIGEQA